MDADKTCNAEFNQQQGSFSLSVAKVGPNNVTSVPAGISCLACNTTFAAGTTVVLTAVAEPGWQFLGWGNCGCSGTGTCTVVMDANKHCFADFGRIGLFVNVNTGSDTGSVNDCRNENNPCKTITHALTQTTGNEFIHVFAGTYNNTNETFPLQLKPGTTLNCEGANHTTVIDADAGDPYQDAIHGAAGAKIMGCRVISDDDETAIDDQGSQITVDNCMLQGGGSPYDGNVGLYLMANSTVTNSDIRGFDGGANGEGPGIYIDDASPTITGSTITQNDVGVSVNGTSLPLINGNSIFCNNDVDLKNDTLSAINVQNNSWDNNPPVIITDTWCDQSGEDICNMGGALANYTGNSVAPGACSASGKWFWASGTGAPTARASHTAVWTGSEMIVWGGYDGSGAPPTGLLNTGGRYDPVADTWLPTDTTPSQVPTARSEHTAVWSGTEMIVWGGSCALRCYLNDGARYDPVTDQWRAMAASPLGLLARENHTAVWSGTEMIVWGGMTLGSQTNTGGRYTPPGGAGLGSWIRWIKCC
jgi:hypothetical protein